MSTRVSHKQLGKQLVGMAFALLVASSPALAAPKGRDTRNACESALRAMEEKERAGQLQSARDMALACSKPACARTVSLQCSTTYARLANEIPSIVVVATDAAGRAQVDVEVRLDGALLTSRLDGRSLAVDPGLHELVVSAPGYDTHSEKVLVAQGQRNRMLAITLQASPAAAPPASPLPVQAVPERPPEVPSSTPSTAADHAPKAPPSPAAAQARSSVWPYVIGGAGLASLGASLALVTWGRHDNDLLDRCAPNCSPKSVTHVKNLYLAADISLGVGIVALGAATWWYFADAGAAPTPTDRGLAVDFRPTRSGAFARVTGSF